ncbi:MAG TPA: tyrosine-type recombinase/integrase [bacterium]
MNDLNFFREKCLERMRVLNYSGYTVGMYNSHLKRFFAFLTEGEVTELSAVNKEHVRDYQTHFYESLTPEGKPYGVATQNNALQSIKTFFRLMREEEYLVHDPARDIQFAKQPQRLPSSILTKQEVRKVLEAPDLKTAMGYRDRALLEVLYSTGMRTSEAGGLKLEDVDTFGGYARIIQGKGKKDRVVPLGRIACRYLENYIREVRPMLTRKNPSNPFVFITLRGDRFGQDVIWLSVKRYARKAKISRNIYPHTFRHTCATLMMRNNANIRHIQEMLGHASLDTTQIYTSVTIADLKAVHRKCHPREREHSG